MAGLRLLLFGSPRLERDGNELPLRRRKALALVAYLAVTRQPQSRDHLLGLLWPEFDTSSARNNLRRELSLLGSELGEGVLHVDRVTVSLNAEAGLWVDAVEFEEKVDKAGVATLPAMPLNPARAASLAEAAAIASADFMAGFSVTDSVAFEEWQFFVQEGLRRKLAIALQALIRWHVERQEFKPAVDFARRWVALDSLYESAQRELMRLYAWDGQQAAALRQYAQFERLLEEELGVPPEDETTVLMAAIRGRNLPPPKVQHGAVAGVVPATAPATLGATGTHRAPTANNLPGQSLQLIGRTRELAALETFLAAPDVRLVTIVGQGGMGKTQLAVAAAWQEALQPGRFPSGVYFVPLAAVDAPGDIVYALAEAIGLALESVGRSPERQIFDYLRGKDMLLLLDNYEHLLPEVGTVAAILQQAPAVKMLVTSHERLYLQEEHLLVLHGLDYPEGPGSRAPDAVTLGAYSAVQLFVERARHAQPDFKLDADSMQAVAEICRQTAGMPLALELAAAWAGMLPAAEIASSIQSGIDFLAANMHDLPVRQRSMRAVFDASWQRLTKYEQETFAQLSIFFDGFTRHAVQHVVTDGAGAFASLHALASLAGKALLRHERRQDRYTIHVLLRQYAAERLAQMPGREAQVRDRHCAYYCAAMQRWLGEIEGPYKREALLAIDENYENVISAWQWAAAHGQVDHLDQAMRALEHHSYWRSRFRDAEALFRSAADHLAGAMPGELPAGVDDRRFVLAALLARQANFQYLLKDWPAAIDLFARSHALLDLEAQAGRDVRAEQAYLLMKSGDLTTDTGVAQQRFAASLALYQQIGHQWWSAGLLTQLGFIALAEGRRNEAAQLLQDGLALFTALGDRWQLGWVRDGLSNVALQKGELAEAEQFAVESLEIHREIGLRDRIADSLTSLSWIALARGDRERAQALFAEAESIWRDIGIEVRTINPTGPDGQPFQPLWFKKIMAGRKNAAGISPATVVAAEPLADTPGTSHLPLQETMSGNGLRAGAYPPAQPLRADRLPHFSTVFIGRERELAEVISLLRRPDCRLLTLRGPGGIGKTRLAVEAGQRMAHAMRDGVHFVPLQTHTTSQSLPATIADALGLTLSSRSDALQQLVGFLREREILLVLDGFEHLMDSAELLVSLLAQAASLKLLVTSHEILSLQEEWIYAVDGLALPPPVATGSQASEDASSYDAVCFFSACAQRVSPTFDLAVEETDVVRICRLVDGIPLALELAAAWTKTLRCSEIVDAIERDFGFLVTNLRNVPERQRSMRATIEQTWQRLSPREQGILQRLAIFRGGLRMDAAAAVAGATLSDLTGFVDRSLLRRDASQRYHIQELLRRYAEEQLRRQPDLAAVTCRRHSSYFLDLLSRWNRDIKGDDQPRAVAAVGADFENVRAAWYFAFEHNLFERIELAADTLHYYCQVRSRFLEGVDLFATAAARLEASPPSPQLDNLLAQLLVYLGWFRIRLGQLDQAEAALTISHARYAASGQPHLPFTSADPLAALGTIANIRGDFANAERLGEEARQRNESLQDRNNLLFAFYVLANAASAQGQYGRAMRYAQHARMLAEEIGDHLMLGYVLDDLGSIALASADFEQAKQTYRASLQIKRSMDNPEGMALTLRHLGKIASSEGAYDEATEYYRQSLALYRQLEDHGGLAAALHGWADAQWSAGERHSAIGGYLEALTVAQEIHYLPRILSILVSVGGVLLDVGRQEQGSTLIASALYHPAGEQTVREHARVTLAQHGITLAEEAIARAIAQSEGHALDIVAKALVAELEILSALPL